MVIQQKEKPRLGFMLILPPEVTWILKKRKKKNGTAIHFYKCLGTSSSSSWRAVWRLGLQLWNVWPRIEVIVWPCRVEGVVARNVVNCSC